METTNIFASLPGEIAKALIVQDDPHKIGLMGEYLWLILIAHKHVTGALCYNLSMNFSLSWL